MHRIDVVAFLSLAARTHASLTSINTAASGLCLADRGRWAAGYAGTGPPVRQGAVSCLVD